MTKKIVVLGAGYAGIRVATQLKHKNGDFEIILVDQNTYHTEKTCLHEVAAGQQAPENIIYSIEDCSNCKKSKFIQDKVVKIDKDNNNVILENHGKIDYDYLVIGLGFKSETFGIKGVEENAFSMVNLDQAVAINKHINSQIRAYLDGDRDKKKLKIIVCGAGFTGVELLGALAEQMPKYAEKHGFSEDSYELVCVESATRLLPMFSENLANYAIDYLKDLGVKFITGAKVNEIKPGIVEYDKDGEIHEIEGGTIIWTTGVSGVDLVSESGFEAKRGRVIVKDDLTVEGYDNVFMLGDVSAVIDPESNRPYPTTAQIALAMASSCVDNILKKLEGKETEKFVYVSKGTVCSLGNTNAVAVVGGKELKGYPASALKKIIATRSIHMGSGKIGLTLKKGRFDLYR